MSGAILEVQDLRTSFHEGSRIKKAVDGVSLTLAPGETLGLVGESGCGKSLTALSIMRLVPRPAGCIEGGSIRFAGRELLSLSEEEMRRVRGHGIAMIFQEPMTALNPVYTVGWQLAEVFATHFGTARTEARRRSVEILTRVGIPDPERRFDEYPHQLSGGMRQRVLIAMALAGGAQVLLADEPTTALDVTIQAQILELINKLRLETGMATLMITHDLGVVAETAHRVAVMYAGRIVETADVRTIFDAPYHPYTEGLIRSLPSLAGTAVGTRLAVIPGTVPDLAELPPGCSFEPRCHRREPICARVRPPLEEKGLGRMARCHVPPDENSVRPGMAS